jgi:hypothetical protein
MSQFFTKQRFGEPQFIAGGLLFIFLAQCAWLVRSDLRSGRISNAEKFVLNRGLERWHGHRHHDSGPEPDTSSTIADQEDAGISGHSSGVHAAGMEDPNRSALYYLISSAPVLLWPGELDSNRIAQWGWLARAPGLLFGLFLGASVWYVARRLYGNAGGYIALLLFCFSPGIIRSSAGWGSLAETGAAWGAFGAIFTGIAVAHTLYAPREVVLWNWRRIVLLGVALTMGIGCQYSLVVLVPVVLGFMLYLAPERSGAAVAIWASACVVALLLLLTSNFFNLAALTRAIGSGNMFAFSGSAFGMFGAYEQLVRQITNACPALLIGVPAAVIVFATWRRARYFGNTAPLLASAIFLALALGMPHYPGLGFRLIVLPFLFLFVAGIAADVLETRHRAAILPAVAGLLAAYALWSVLGLARVRV